MTGFVGDVRWETYVYRSDQGSRRRREVRRDWARVSEAGQSHQRGS